MEGQLPGRDALFGNGLGDQTLGQGSLLTMINLNHAASFTANRHPA